jgi:hypothetical protein
MKELEKITAKRRATTRTLWVCLTVTLALATFNNTSYAEQPPAPCFANPRAARDSALIKNRGDIRNLPEPLKARIIRMADRPHSILPVQAFAEADRWQRTLFRLRGNHSFRAWLHLSNVGYLGPESQQ